MAWPSCSGMVFAAGARLVSLAWAWQGKRSGGIPAGLGCVAVLPGGDQHGERGDRLVALRAAHWRRGDALHAHRRWPAGVRSWRWHDGERPVPPGSLTLVKVRVQGAALTPDKKAASPRRRWTAHAAHSRPVPAAAPAPRQDARSAGQRARRSRCAPHRAGGGLRPADHCRSCRHARRRRIDRRFTPRGHQSGKPLEGPDRPLPARQHAVRLPL
jgi:hypothetical protein